MPPLTRSGAFRAPGMRAEHSRCPTERRALISILSLHEPAGRKPDEECGQLTAYNVMSTTATRSAWPRMNPYWK